MRISFHSIADTIRDLGDDEVHLWSAPLDRGGDESLLTEEERTRAGRFKVERIRRQYTASRGQLRFVLSRYLGIEPGAVPILREPSGKPILDPQFGSTLHFNVAHSDSLAVYALTRRGRIGVDVERSRVIPNATALIERFFTRRECGLFQALPESERQAAFLRAWTRKEATLKAVGQGVQALDQCDVTIGDGEPEKVLRMGDDEQAADKWLLRSWQPTPDYVAAVAVELQV